ncbi:Na(+)/citrate cotransporter-like [Palaemon carinicauda]|uniref:Na(+)/citrate cotransporter-like n=1 Tax=Palaemon carinicauda TaxID=392227 RepID=UPI0035B649E7
MRTHPLTIWAKNNWRFIFTFLVPLVFAIMPIMTTRQEAKCGYVILVMACYWMTEVVPMAVTSLIPVFAFPMFGILSTAECCLVYMKATNVMFLGGLMVAIGVEHCNLHKRIALLVILYVGQSPARLMAGFMLVTTFLSMWISNTATTAMMVPIVNAILDELYPNDSRKKRDEMEITDAVNHSGLEMVSTGAENKGFVTDDPRSQIGADLASASEVNPDVMTKSEGKEIAENGDSEPKRTERDLMARALYLGVAYSANTGGTGVVTGTAPNLVMMSILANSFSSPTGLNFATWIAFNLPGMIICNVLAWLWLQFLFMGLGCKKGGIQKASKEREDAVRRVISQKYKELGRITQHEVTVLILFLILVALWLFRAPGFIEGWSAIFTHDKKISDASAAMLIVFLLFALPSRFEVPWSKEYKNNPPRTGPQPCLSWAPIHEKVPWNIVLLLGGGFAIAEAAAKSGLSIWLGVQFEGLQVLPKEAIVFLVSLLTAMITEVASNTATASILLPVLKEMAINIKVNPIYLMLPATICCSYAFMLPVATAPNAIVFSAANMKSTDMMKAGFVMNMLCILVINIMINTLGVAMFDLHNMPEWTAS